jgi:hypothetical protein
LVFDTKFAIVLRDDLAVWQKLNVTAFLTSGIVAQFPDIIGEPYRDRLLRLPAFLRERDTDRNGWSDQDLQDGFRMTGLFLLRHVLEPRGQSHSDARNGFINAVNRHRAGTAAELVSGS